MTSRRCSAISPARGGAAPVRRALVGLAVLALAVPAAAWPHATLKQEWPAFEQELQSAPKLVRLRFDQFVKFPSIEVLRRLRPELRRARADGRSLDRRPGAGAPDRRLHGSLACALVRGRARRVRRLDVRRARGAAAHRGVRRERSDPHRARRALALLPRARARDRLTRLPAPLPTRPRAPAGASRSGCTSSRRSAWSACSRSGSSPSACAARTSSSCRSGSSSTATCRRSPAARASARRSSR